MLERSDVAASGHVCLYICCTDTAYIFFSSLSLCVDGDDADGGCCCNCCCCCACCGLLVFALRRRLLLRCFAHHSTLSTQTLRRMPFRSLFVRHRLSY